MMMCACGHRVSPCLAGLRCWRLGVLRPSPRIGIRLPASVLVVGIYSGQNFCAAAKQCTSHSTAGSFPPALVYHAGWGCWGRDEWTEWMQGELEGRGARGVWSMKWRSPTLCYPPPPDALFFTCCSLTHARRMFGARIPTF
jgi:hypothetical protein